MKLKSIKKLELKTISKESPRKKFLKKLRTNREEEEHENDQDKLYFISSGCTPLNLALTGHKDKGYPIGRIINPKGAYSSGKTGLAITLINVAWYIEHLKKGKKIKIAFDDAEHAFDYEWAESLGVPVEKLEIIEPPSETVEELQYNLWKFIEENKECDFTIYILDSLDALSDEGEKKFLDKKLKAMKKRKEKEDDEKEEKDDKGTFGASKAKAMSMFCRTLANDLSKTNCLFFPISQLRDDLNKKYGNKSSTSGGRAIGFYSTIRMDLNKGSKLFKNKSSVIPYGREIPITIEKNKIYGEGGSCVVEFLFKIGVDDIGSTLEFCGEYKGIPKNGGYYTWKGSKYYKADIIKKFEDNKDEFEELRDIAQLTWNKIVKNSSVERKSPWK